MDNGPPRPSRDVITKRRLFEEIALRLEQMIYSGELPVGAPLPSERELMERYGVGRPAVREAMLWLRKKGLISVTGGERARVTEPDPADLLQHLSGAAHFLLAKPEGIHLFQRTRLFVEVALAREAAMMATPEDIAALEAALLANEAVGADDREGFAATDDDFHFAIAQISRNPVVKALYNAVLELLHDQRATSLKHPEAAEKARRCHRGLFEAIRDHDPDRAEAVMRQHLSDVEATYWSVKRGG
ncbi:MAG: FCD domain-containing protein [Rhodospirillaceae bacterium]|nr:FCD domain-containing protein [Rhodospirillaceae bacterium]